MVSLVLLTIVGFPTSWYLLIPLPIFSCLVSPSDTERGTNVSGFLTVLVSYGCHSKMPQARWIKAIDLLSYSSGCLVSIIKESAGPHFL